MYTAGSATVTGYYKSVRQFGAQVRRVLIENAARHWGVPVAELTTEPNVVVHAKSGRKLGYGEIASFAVVPEKAPEIGPNELKKPSEFRYIGKDVMRVELPTKVNGTAKYSIDVQVPGMLYGAMLRSPVEGNSAREDRRCQGTRDSGRAARSSSILMASAWWQKRHGRPSRRRTRSTVVWTRTAKARNFNTDTAFDGHTAVARGTIPNPVEIGEKVGDAPAAFNAAASVIEADLPLRLRLSRADGAAECRRVGVAGRRLGGDLVRHPEPADGRRRNRPGARHPDRQGQAERHADGRRLRPSRQSRPGIRGRCRPALKRDEAAGEGDVDARGRRPQRPVPAVVGAYPARRLRCEGRARRVASSLCDGQHRAVPGSGANTTVRGRRWTGSRSPAPTFRPTRSPIGSRNTCRSRPASGSSRSAASASSPTSSRPKSSSTSLPTSAAWILSAGALPC